jgi:hypothetical protein
MLGPVGIKKGVRHPDDIPEVVENFRNVISNVKKEYFATLESPKVSGKASAQDPNKLNNIISKITTFGNIVMVILNNPNNQESSDVMKIFNANNINFQNLNNEERDLCKYYIHVDIYSHPYDVNGHAEKNLT